MSKLEALMALAVEMREAVAKEEASLLAAMKEDGLTREAAVQELYVAAVTCGNADDSYAAGFNAGLIAAYREVLEVLDEVKAK